MIFYTLYFIYTFVYEWWFIFINEKNFERIHESQSNFAQTLSPRGVEPEPELTASPLVEDRKDFKVRGQAPFLLIDLNISL